MSKRTIVRGVVPYVFCADAGATADWCVAVLGFEERARWDRDGSVGNVELTVGEHEIWLDGPVPDWKSRFGDLPCWTGFWVDDVDAMYEQLRAHDVQIDPPVTRDFGIRQLTVTDPEGHQWGFLRRLDA